ncbi:MAG: hypothetical protein AB1665_09065 [Candidatus Thermoplasmatota archaeon]
MRVRAFLEILSPPRLLVLVILLVIALGMRYTGVLIHEVLGHGLAAEATGGEFFAVYASPMSGYSSVYMRGTSWLPLMYLAGLAVTFIVGTLVLCMVSRSRLSGMRRVYALLFCEGLLIPAALYFSVGAMMKEGDTAKAFPLLGMRPEIAIFIGVWIGLGYSILLSREFARVSIMKCEGGFERSFVLWAPGLLLSLLGTAVSAVVSIQGAWVSILYGGTHAAFAVVGSLSAVKVDAAWSAEPDLRTGVTAAVSFALVLSLWLGAFGLSEDSAHGLLLKPPPPEVEGGYMGGLVGNVYVRLRANLTAEVEVRLKPLLTEGSPLDRRIHDTFEERPYLPFYAAESSEMVRKMLLLSISYARKLDTAPFLNGEVRAQSKSYSNGRSCIFQVELNQSDGLEPWDGGWNITIVDPWRAGGGYIDLLSLEWDEGIEIINITQQGGKPHHAMDRMLLWENDVATDAPYAITLQVTLLSPQR